MARMKHAPITIALTFAAALLAPAELAQEQRDGCSDLDDDCDQSVLLQISLQSEQKNQMLAGNSITHGREDSASLPLSGEVGGLLGEFYFLSSGVSPSLFDPSQLTPNLTRFETSINFPLRQILLDSFNFCAIFSGGLRIHTAGTYTMSLISDDGSLLLIDGALVVNNDGWHGMLKVSADVDLAAGDHPIEVKFSQGGHGAGLILRYSGPDTGGVEWVVQSTALVAPLGHEPITTTTTTTRLPSIGEVGGLQAEFWYSCSTNTVNVLDDLAGQAPDVSRVDTTINYPSTGGTWPGLTQHDNFCAKWSGGLRIFRQGTYRLSLTSDDGSVLMLDGAMVVNNDGYHGMRTVNADVELVAGDHPLEVRFFEAGWGAGVIFTYSGPDTIGEVLVVPPAVLVAPAGVQPPQVDPSPPRYGLLSRRSEMLTDVRDPRAPLPKDEKNHNECNYNTPDGRLFFCGEASRWVRYFKFESLSHTVTGMPIFNDSTWSVWPERLFIPDQYQATGCHPNWKKPFEELADGSHFYSFYATSVNHRTQINVTVANPMTPQAEIVSLTQGNPESWNTVLPLYHYFTMDGKMVVGDGQYSALPESGESCSLNGWHPIRNLVHAVADADELNLPSRYPFARWPMYEAGGQPWPDAGQGRYFWIDLDARNLWYERANKWQILGEDTYGMEYTVDGALNLPGREERVRFMSSTLWNFESERTAAQRFPGELHTSGVGSGCSHQLPMSKKHHVLPVFDAKAEFYTEIELVSTWKSPHWDIFFRPMTVAGQNSQITPDMSRHFLNGQLLGNCQIEWHSDTAPTTGPYGQGARVKVQGDSAIVVDLSAAGDDVPGVTSSTRAFTAQLSFLTYQPSSTRPLLDHPNISLFYGNGALTWTFNGESFSGGSYVRNQWYHLALVFDGVDQTVETFNNGFEVATTATAHTSFQLGKDSVVVLANSITDNFGTSGHDGLIDQVQFQYHARAQKVICARAWGSDCGSAIAHNPSTTQFYLSMQIKECSAATMHTIACSSAIHRVCANLDAKLGKDAGISNDLLDALTPPGPPVSMGGVPVSIGSDTVEIACTPHTDHLSIPVDWHIMEKYDSNCNLLTNHSSLALHCNFAAHGFCKDAHTSINTDMATGVIFESDARAWVSCFAADQVLTEDVTTLSACSADLAGPACQLEVAALCTTHDGGVAQAIDNGVLTVHCFNAPMGLHSFTL